MTTLAQAQLTGRISLPNNVSPANAAVGFTLTAVDTDNVLDITVLPQTFWAEVDDEGDIVIGLWPNARGTRSTQYDVTVRVKTTEGDQIFGLGKITMPQAASDLNDLLA